jgi:hypothetical protein
MAYRKPENRTQGWWRTHHETVAQMRSAGWSVHSECMTCRLRIRLDLELTMRVSGPHVSLWNHRQPCPSLGCWSGAVRFWGRPPECMQPFVLEAPWPPEREPGWWLEAKELRKAGLE